MHLPKNIYELIPLIYAISGIITLIAFAKPPMWIGIISGIMLITASLSILRMRYEFRKGPSLPKAYKPTKARKARTNFKKPKTWGY